MYVLSLFTRDNPRSHPAWKLLSAGERAVILRFLRSKEITGKSGEVKTMPLRRGKLLVLGLGERKSWDLRRLSLFGRRVVQAARAERCRSVAVWLEPASVTNESQERLGQSVAENAVMAVYDFNKYKQPDTSVVVVREFVISVPSQHLAGVREGARVGQVVGEAVNHARDLGNTPGGEMTPTLLAKVAQVLGKEHGFKVRVLGRKELVRLGAGGILGVAHGSSEEPKLILMEYAGGKKREQPAVFVGKGVTFDSGGLNLKPTGSIIDMHLDMLGGAAVMGAISAIAELKLPMNIIGVVPAVENMPGSAGYRPGDLLKSLSGKTIEVLNTDAEGRIILADALTYGARLKPSFIVDVATLTGSCAVALGEKLAGLFTSDEKLQAKLVESARVSGDHVWPMPMWDEYEDEVKGTFGDLQNAGKSRYGDAIVAALFLKRFVGDVPWAHLDIAGPMKTTDGQALSKGATGFGVRLLVELARSSGT